MAGPGNKSYICISVPNQVFAGGKQGIVVADEDTRAVMAVTDISVYQHIRNVILFKQIVSVAVSALH